MGCQVPWSLIFHWCLWRWLFRCSASRTSRAPFLRVNHQRQKARTLMTLLRVRSGPGKPNQRKVSSWTFRRGIPEQKFNVNRACFPKEKHQNSQKWAKFMNFSFWPFMWFGFPGRLLRENRDLLTSLSKSLLGVLSHHLKCEMKSPHLVDFSWDFVDFQSNLSQSLADVRPILAEISRD